MKTKKPSKIERDIKKDDRSLEGWSDIILRKDKTDRTPEQQRNDMFKTMNEANKNRESYDPTSFEELGVNKMKDINKYYCPVCKKETEHYRYKPHFMSNTNVCVDCKVLTTDED